MAGAWHGLVHQPTFQVSTMLLLSDGRVMVQEEATPHWHALTPDDTGSYVNGTWSTLKDMSIWRRYYASGMLKDGRIVVIGGEQSGAGNDTTQGEIYDPVSDTWSPMPSPPGLDNGGRRSVQHPARRQVDDRSIVAVNGVRDLRSNHKFVVRGSQQSHFVQ